VSLHLPGTGRESGRFRRLTQLLFSAALIGCMRDLMVVNLYTQDRFAGRTLNLTSSSGKKISITGTAPWTLTLLYPLPAGISVTTAVAEEPIRTANAIIYSVSNAVLQ